MNTKEPKESSRLPIYDAAADIVDAVDKHRVVIVEGPAGCGKTTQLPRLLKQARLVPTRIGITQPRRIAAIGVASRIAQEEHSALGQDVGYTIRFDDMTCSHTRIKVMTDGILLQEARLNAQLSDYDIIMVDEAHERSLNIDLVLGLLHRLLKERQDLKVVISSATLHPELFVRFFEPVVKDVPVISVKTRNYPVHIDYRPLASGAFENVIEAVTEHVRDVLSKTMAGHVLVFLPGEGMINTAQQVLQKWRLVGVRIVPLFGRLTQKEQAKVFEETGHRKVILATNIAETSITIDNTVAVIDSGLHKLPWHDSRTQVTMLREEPVSRASAEQRAGRAGRTQPGLVVRMYAEEALAQRPQFTPEEILRIDLSEAVLRLIDLGIRDVELFAFVTPPPKYKLVAALKQLQALGAIDDERNLTDIGRQMVPYPLSPALARMVVEACSRHRHAVSDVLLVGAFLSVRSPFSAPQGFETEAHEAQRRLQHEMGDAITQIRLFNKWQGHKDPKSFCRQNFIEHDTMLFIERAHAQLMDIAQSSGACFDAQKKDDEAVLRCLATGFADKVLQRSGHLWQTHQGLNVAVHPSSALFASRAQCAVAAELMQSGRLYAFNVSALRRDWVASVLQHQRRSTAPEKVKATQAEVPATIELFGLTLNVQTKGRPSVALQAHDAQTLLHHDTQDLLAQLPLHAAHAWRARVYFGEATVLRGRLGLVLGLLPLVPWPLPDTATPKLPWGTLLQIERSLHLVVPNVSLLGCWADGPHVPRPGFAALVTNGHGDIWFDISAEFDEAVRLSDMALGEVIEALAWDEATVKALGQRQEELAEVTYRIADVKRQYGRRPGRNRAKPSHTP